MIEARGLPLLATGMFATLYQIAEGIRAKGHGGDDFRPNNALMVAGGTLVFGGELSEFARRSCVAALAITFLVLGAGLLTTLFGVGGATVL